MDTQEATQSNEQPDDDEAVKEDGAKDRDPNALPEWVDVPSGLKIPAGASVGYMRFRPKVTAYPDKGERQCIMWPLTDNDERVAMVRCRDNPANAYNELAKQTVRAIDGIRVDWGKVHGQPGNIDDFWREIGPKCRDKVVALYRHTHTMSIGETADFLEHCLAVRTAS